MKKLIFVIETKLTHNDIIKYGIDYFNGKDVLECGCGRGQHTSFVASRCNTIIAVDLNTAEIARKNTKHLKNVTILEGDIATIELGRKFDIVFCIGVIHHTNNPDKTFQNLLHHVKTDGKLIIWTYSAEGNGIMRYIVEPIRKSILSKISRKNIRLIAKFITAALYTLVYTVYQISIFSFLPYYKYFQNFQKLSFERNVLNIFDKMNAPQTQFTTKAKCDEWFNTLNFKKNSIYITRYKGVSYSLVGEKKGPTR